jgi:hypothetical protein
MIQLIEFLISGYLLTWLRVEGFDYGIYLSCFLSMLIRFSLVSAD